MDIIMSHAVAECHSQPLFKTGVVKCMPEAGDLLGRDKTNLEATNKIVADMVARHMTADFGLAPREVVAQNIQNIVAHPDTLKVLSVYSLDKTQTEPRKIEDNFHQGDIHVVTEVRNGTPQTWLLSAGEMQAHMIMAQALDRISRALKPSVSLEGITPVGRA